ncbi:hypothetical protein LCGC14_1665130 [marine sediment metagenome]|uniref:Uncharacterized protein n=1 Tax=marine sediment metagenome TaxID=412755 RepID=A0A0F9K8Q0_9ZZZZ
MLRRLKREARESCTWRGHSMKPFETVIPNKRVFSECRNCTGYVQVDTFPPPNGIDIGGDALALNCPIKESD